MVTLSIKSDFKQVQARLNALSSDVKGRVISAALNKVVAKGNTTMVREITSEFAISATEVRSKLKVTKASRSIGNWVASLEPFATNKKGRGLNLIRFVEKRVTLAEAKRRSKSNTLRDLRFQIKKSGGKKTIKGAFIGNNGRTVFVRTGKDRLPIKAVTTIDVAQMFNTKRINKVVLDRINAELPIEVDRAIKSVLARGFK